MTLCLSDYCYCRFPLEETGEKTITYNHHGMNIFLVSSGRCIVHCKNENLTVNTGDIFCAYDPIIIDIVAEGHIIGFNIDGTIAEKFGQECTQIFTTNGIFAPFLPQQILQVVTNYHFLAESFLCNAAFEIINTLLSSDKKSVMASRIVAEAVALIKQNYATVYGVEELAENLNVSKSHLVREFCKYTGVTPGKYLTNVRIEAVKQLLVQEHLSLNTIAALTGFSGDNYLCKAFKKVTGETPMVYRAKTLSAQYTPNQLSITIEPEIYL